ncbi:MAG: hypothetical protein Fur0034_03080 [Desulfuromonadia bacterium]
MQRREREELRGRDGEHIGGGALPNSVVDVYSMTPLGMAGDILGSSTSSADGSFVVSAPLSRLAAPVILSTTGPEGNRLRAVIGGLDRSRGYAITPLTEEAYQQLQRIVTDRPGTQVTPEVISALQARIGTIFSIDDIRQLPANGTAYAAVLTVIDQMVIDSGSFSRTISLLNRALADVTGRDFAMFRDQFAQVVATVTAKDPSLTTTLASVMAGLYSPPSEPVWGDTTPPGPVTNLRGIGAADNSTSCSVTLIWSPASTTGVNPVVGYEISRGGVKLATVSVTTYADRPLAPETSFEYSVRAIDAAGNRSSALSVTVTTPRLPNLTIDAGGQLTTDLLNRPYKDIFPPDSPSGITATATVIDQSTSSVHLTWQTPADDTGVVLYEVYRDGVKVATVTTTGSTDPLVTSGVSHTYLIYALDAEGNRSPQGSISITPVSPNLTINAGGTVSP